MQSEKSVLLITLFLAFEGLTTNSQNDFLQYSTLNFPGYKGEEVLFGYSQYSNLVMFSAMASVYVYWKLCKKPNMLQQTYSFCSVKQIVFYNPYVLLVLAAVLDLTCFGMMSYGLHLGVTPSIFEVLNGSAMLFTSLFSWMFLKRKIVQFEIIGMLIMTVGLLVIGMSSYFAQKYFVNIEPNTPDNFGNMLLGMVIIILAQIFGAWQLVIEEFAMQYLNIEALQVVYIEGIYGFLFTLCFQMPLFDMFGMENDFDAFVFIGNEPMCLIPQAVCFVSMIVYDVSGQLITKEMSANHRAILESVGGLVVWVFGIIDNVAFGKSFGEKIYGWASGIQLIGYIIDLLGGLVFYGLVKLPPSYSDGEAESGSKVFSEFSINTISELYEPLNQDSAA